MLEQRPNGIKELNYETKHIPISLFLSGSASQNLLTNMIGLLLNEQLGYEIIYVKCSKPLSEQLKMRNLLNCATESSINMSVNAMVDIETHPYQVQYSNNETADYLLGPEVTPGWFFSQKNVEQQWRENRLILDNWRSLKTKSFMQHFHNGNMINNCTVRSRKHSIHNYQNGSSEYIFTSIPANTELPQKFFSAVLNITKVIRWSFESLIDCRFSNNVPTLIMHWSPSSLMATSNLTQIMFPLITKPKQRKLRKKIWLPLRDLAPDAFAVIQNVHFTQNQYISVIDKYLRTASEQNFTLLACDWLKENQEIWSQWVKHIYKSNKVPVYIAGMFPIRGSFRHQPGIVPGADIAIDFINRDEHVLPNTQIRLLIQDTQCTTDIALKQFMNLFVNDSYPIIGILGPGCSDTTEAISAVSKHFKFIAISYSANSEELGNRNLYPYFFRTSPQRKLYAQVFVSMLNELGWNRIALFEEDVPDIIGYHNFLHEYFSTENINVALQRRLPHQATSLDVVNYFESIKQREVYIIILTSTEITARAVFCEAYKRKMTWHDGYVWFVPADLTSEWWDTDYFNIGVWGEVEEYVPCSSKEILASIQGHFTIQNEYFAEDNVDVIGNLTVSEWKKLYINHLRMKSIKPIGSATYAHDAVWAFALALDKLLRIQKSSLQTLRTDPTIDLFMKFIQESNFLGVSGKVAFHGADRIGNITIFQFIEQYKHEIGKYNSADLAQHLKILNKSAMVWKNGIIPVDGPQLHTCNVEPIRILFGLSCQTTNYIIHIVIILTFVSIMLTFIICLKKQYDVKVRFAKHQIKQLSLYSDPPWLTLDQWELNRKQVILNRKLGEGAFGTVFGGEALINNIWKGIAVKTLRIGATTEEKIDFLTEADIMKHFDHINIVKLLGVCTKSEPTYTIMEFMLHGDLKTYLLARRSLINMNGICKDDISAKSLTSMAKDVAQGLQYLFEKKYIHRDIACRNCLIHTKKQIKICDFGMTRHLFDNDFYEFKMQGVLPIRWMAIESLNDGIFSFSSDIWSYGVLLYEMVTLGSLPYQGWNNQEVLDNVKNGMTMSLKEQVSVELKQLIRSCWNANMRCRPNISEIIDVLGKQPNLLMPCYENIRYNDEIVKTHRELVFSNTGPTLETYIEMNPL